MQNALTDETWADVSSVIYAGPEAPAALEKSIFVKPFLGSRTQKHAKQLVDALSQ